MYTRGRHRFESPAVTVHVLPCEFWKGPLSGCTPMEYSCGLIERSTHAANLSLVPGTPIASSGFLTPCYGT